MRGNRNSVKLQILFTAFGDSHSSREVKREVGGRGKRKGVEGKIEGGGRGREREEGGNIPQLPVR